MEFVESFSLSLDANIIDIGDSHFVDALLIKGYKNIYVLDISATAIEKAKQRLGERASKVLDSIVWRCMIFFNAFNSVKGYFKPC